MALRRTAPLFIAVLMLVTACNLGSSGDYLERIKSAGVIKVSTDPAYPPQSFLNEDTNELEGFDIDVAKEIGERLGVDVQFETPSFDAVVAGAWSNRWDMSVGSVTITPEREEILDFTQSYYYTPARWRPWKAATSRPSRTLPAPPSAPLSRRPTSSGWRDPAASRRCG